MMVLYSTASQKLVHAAVSACYFDQPATSAKKLHIASVSGYNTPYDVLKPFYRRGALHSWFVLWAISDHTVHHRHSIAVFMDGESSQEDIEYTFHAAADHLQQLVSVKPTEVHDAVKLQLYGLYKQASVGSCTTARPSFWHRAARLKWQHWERLRGMTAECAMQQYIETLDNVDPGWRTASSSRGQGRQGQGGVGGPVFSTLRDPSDQDQQHPNSSQADGSLQAAAGLGDLSSLKSLLAAGIDVNNTDENGCTALHFAADRGQVTAAELLLQSGANINQADLDGQSPLHYAATCGKLQLCKLLLAAGADAGIQDCDGQVAKQLAPQHWDCW